MRLIYADESGVSPKDPLAVVCAIMVVPDGPWLALEADIEALKLEVPEPYRKDFVFRASDLLARISNKYDATVWPREARIQLLARLVALPAKHLIPVTFGYADNVQISGIPRSETSLIIHAMAYAHAIVGCDTMINDTGQKDEMALLFVEDSQRAKEVIDFIHEGLKNPDFIAELKYPDFRPLSRIKDSVNFVKKSRATFLQLADGCASVVRRQLSAAPENEVLLANFLAGQPTPDVLRRKDGIAAASACFYWRETR